MRKFFFMVMLAGVAMSVGAQNKVSVFDSAHAERLQEVVVKGVRGQENAPYATTLIKKQTLHEFSKTGRELPMLFSETPGVMGWSENGLGSGTAYMRIRGSRDARINVTLDGVPLNSPEDQCVFWANMNSYAALMGSVQIHRGVGTSTNGDGAFSGSIALSTAAPSIVPTGEVSFSYGSYNTMNIGGNISTGLLWNRLILEGAYHITTTDGYVHGTKGRSGSYFGGATWMGDGFQIRYKNIGNFETTGQAWNGVVAGTNDLSIMDGTYGEKTGIKTYKDMYNVGLGKFNSLYEGLIINGDGTYTTERYRLANGSLWDRTTDNFWQNHNILSGAFELGEHWTAAASLHYTYGYGYYEEFRPQNKLSKFGLPVIYDADGNKIKRGDFVRRKGLTQHTYGLVSNVNYKDEAWDIIGGMAIQNFDGNHFGRLTYAYTSAGQLAFPDQPNKLISSDNTYTYYDSNAHKFDYNMYLKAAYNLTENWSVFGDVQYRHVKYKTNGINDKFYEENSRYYNQQLDINKVYDFFNPKAGFTAHYGNHRFYGSVAMSHREPERNNFTDNGSYDAPRPEQLIDYEMGYKYNDNKLRAGVNLYYMDYRDQFVQTGELSDIGEPLTTNIKKSYRAGVELQAGYDPFSWLSIDANAALSSNKIKDFDEVVEDWDNGSQTIHYNSTTLAFAPAAILNGFLRLHYKGWQTTWHSNYVGRQYLDNTENKDRSLPAYDVHSIYNSYTLDCRKWMGLKEAVFTLALNNIFNRHYSPNGWVYSAIYESGGHPNDNRYYQIGFVPMAGFTIQGSVTLRF